MSLDERKQRGLQLLDDMLGPEAAKQTREHWESICPEFGEYVIEFVAGEVWSRDGLDRKSKSLVTIAATAAIGRPRALDLNIRMALQNGATRREIVETLLQLAPYAGFPAAWEALAAAHKVFEEVKQT